MYWYGDGHAGGWWYAVIVIGMVLFWAAIITVGVLVARALAGRDSGTQGSDPHAATRPPSPSDGAEQILAERYARGEIDEHEYATRLATLRGHSHT